MCSSDLAPTCPPRVTRSCSPNCTTEYEAVMVPVPLALVVVPGAAGVNAPVAFGDESVAAALGMGLP